MYISVEEAIMIATESFKTQYGAGEELAEDEAHVIEFKNCILIIGKRNGKMDFEFIEGLPFRVDKYVHMETLEKVPINVTFPSKG